MRRLRRRRTLSLGRSNDSTASHKERPYERRPRPRRIRRRLRLGRRLPDPAPRRPRRHRRPEPDHLARRRRRRHPQRDRPPRRPRRPRRPLVRGRRRHRGRERPERRRTRLHRGVCSRRRRVGQLAHRRPAAGCAGSADPPARGRVPLPRQGQVRRLVRRGRRPRPRPVHGRRAGPVGCRGARRRGHEAGVEHQAQLGTWSRPTTT